MSAPARSGGGERMIHQDFIARIRYSNALPPPPNPPKLLDIPNTGLSSGQYTNPGFASRLAREQPLNIEADAELGMALDLVGMPGVFDGDESSIQAPPHPPAIHPHDRPLLRPLASLGRPKVADASVSFLRRTEYISSLATRQHESSSRALLPKPQGGAKRAAPEPASDSPAAIKRKIDKGFDVAEQSLQNPKGVRHPNPRQSTMRVVEAYPLLPDLDAFPDSGAYVAIKFLSNPVPKASSYDTRLLSGVFRPIERSPAEEAAYEAAVAAHQRDPENHPKPQNPMNYDFYLPETMRVGNAFRARFDTDNEDRDEDGLYTHRNSGGGCFHFTHVRAYETEREQEYEHHEKYDAELFVAVRDEAEGMGGGDKIAYYYPVMQSSHIRPQRNKNIARTIGVLADEGDHAFDQLDVTVDDPPEEVVAQMHSHRDHPYGPPAEIADDGEQDEVEPEESGGGRERPSQRGDEPTPSDQDAEGDEDED